VKLLFEAIILGILSGGIYALMASGLTLIFGVMDIINVAIGIFVILGAYLSLILERNLHIDLFLGLLLTTPIMFFIGMGIEWAFIRRIKNNRVMLSLLAMFAIAQVIEGILTFFFSTDYKQLYAPYLGVTFKVAGIYLDYFSVAAFLLSILLLGVLYLLIYRTDFGYSLRATVQNPTAATLIGIDVNRIAMITFGIGTAVTAIGGMAFGATQLFNPATSYDLISRLIVIIVLGGLGSLRGAFIGAMSLLVISSVVAVVWSDTWSSTVFFVLLVVLLIFRPQGLFGRLEVRKQ
jgi:branched-chain amino acid transport system permease protein